MKTFHWTCAAGHDCHELVDDGDTASEIAIKQTRLRFVVGGCDTYVKQSERDLVGTRCGAKVTETIAP